MELMQVLKILSKDEQWGYIVPFSRDPSMIEVHHISGIYYYKECNAVAIRDENDNAVYTANHLSYILTKIMSRLLERKLNKRSQ